MSAAHILASVGKGPPAFIAAGAVSEMGTGSTVTPALPAGVRPGMLLVAVVVTNDNIHNASATGWTLLSATGSSAVVPNAQILFKIAGAGETAPTFNGNGTTSRIAAVVLAYWSVQAAWDVGAGVVHANASPVATSSLTTTLANDLVLSLAAAASTGLTWTQPAGTSLRVNYGGANLSFALADEVKAVPGATTARSFAYSPGTGGANAIAASMKN